MSSANNSGGFWPPRRPSKRSKLRNGTFIIPSTGERSRRQFTLRLAQDSTEPTEDNAEERRPFYTRAGMAQRFRALGGRTRDGAKHFWQWLHTSQGRGVMKCTIAYTLASLWTFWGPLSDSLGRPDGKHVCATITVYFHPARTAGSMIEAALIAIIAVCYAEIISILSMAASVFFGSVLSSPTTAYVVVLMVFIGGGFGFAGWVKQRMNHPSVNVGVTLASLAIIAAVTKETTVYTSVFSNEKILQMLQILVIGVTTTTAVNLLLWRVSARILLRQSMIKASTSLGDMLSMITHSFLSGSEDELSMPEFKGAANAWRSNYAAMTKNLKESKYEYYAIGREKTYQLDKAVYKSMENLAQSIGGLKSAAHTQFELLKELPEATSGLLSPGTEFAPQNLGRSIATLLKSGKDRTTVLSAIDEATDESSSDDASRKKPVRSASQGEATPAFRAPSDIFELFIELLGPSMKSLTYTLSEVLREPPFGGPPNYEITIHDQFRQSLSDALGLFNGARADALKELYRSIELGRPRSEKLKADFEEVAAACGHFSFSLQTFGEEMSRYLDVLDDLRYITEHGKRSWRWVLFWRDPSAMTQNMSLLPFDDPDREPVRPLRKSQLPRGIPDSMLQRRDTYSWQASPQSNKIVQTWSQWLLKVFRVLRREDIRFGLKVGLGAMLFASLAFFNATRPTYTHWRGEWGLLSFMIVCSMTVGASNTSGFTRFISTVIGASCSVISWDITQGNAVPLIFLGSFIAFCTFYIIIQYNKAPLGRTILLAYNVSTLYAYSLSQQVDDDDDDEGGVHPLIMEIAKHRAFAVTAGIIWALIVCRLVWPISARKKFKEGMSVLYLQMGLIWKRGPLAILLRSDCTRSYLKSGEQAALQRYASHLDVLRTASTSEFELRGPFPFEAYGRIMASTNHILDAFYAMSLVTQRRGHLTEGERALLLATADERAQLCDRICHVFQVLASSIMLEYPLTDAIPSITSNRDRLLGKIFQFRKEHAAALAAASGSSLPGGARAVSSPGAEPDDAGGSSSKSAAAPQPIPPQGLTTVDGKPVLVEERDYALLYAYALVTGQVAEELKMVEKEIEGLFGVLHEESLLLQ